MNYLDKIITDFELQSVEGIRTCFGNGINPNDYYNKKPLIYELIAEYPRGPKFKACVKAFVDFGLVFEEKALLAVLLDDGVSLETALKSDPQAVHKKYSFQCAFTPVHEASLLHICAEFNHVSCATMLIKYGADVNFKAGVDENGFGAQTPIFHTVNQNENSCIDVMRLLVSEGADVSYTVKGLVWGKGYLWETFIPSVNPTSYAMMGLLPQFQRKEKNIYEVVNILLKAAHNIDYNPPNVPNAYLKS